MTQLNDQVVRLNAGLINGAILLNAAGRFKETAKPEVVDTRPQW